jgi:hypothetical protein
MCPSVLTSDPPQANGGVEGLFDGAELGPAAGLLELGPEQQFINQKMRPGSGVLSVQVLPDGPTRVLQVSFGCIWIYIVPDRGLGTPIHLRVFLYFYYCLHSFDVFTIIL